MPLALLQAAAETAGRHPLAGTAAEWMWALPMLPLAGFVINAALSIVPEYARLLLVPLQLSADYEPRVLVVQHGLGASVFAGVALLGLYAIAVVRSWRGEPRIAFECPFSARAIRSTQ